MEQEITKKMSAFHGKAEIKEKYLKRVITHRKADEIIKGKYREGGKGCAVGCTLEYSNSQGNIHKLMETELGIPEELARTEDWLFESLENGYAKLFPEQFLKSINVGADLSDVCRKFKLQIQKDNLKLQIEQSKNFPEFKEVYEQVIKAIKGVIELLKNPQIAQSAARSAAWSAESAARSAESAARSAWSAAYSRMAEILLKLLREAK